MGKKNCYNCGNYFPDGDGPASCQGCVGFSLWIPVEVDVTAIPRTLKPM